MKFFDKFFTVRREDIVESIDKLHSALEQIVPLIEKNGELICVISDYMMYPMRGSELLGRLEILSPASKKIMLTGQADLQAVSEVLSKARLFRYIEKINLN